MKCNIAYGDKFLDVSISTGNLMGIVEPRGINIPAPGKELIENALANPIGSQRLGSIIKQKGAKNAVIIVNDVTRPTPYNLMLPPLLNEIEAAGIARPQIKLIVATGIHRPHTLEDNLAIWGDKICSQYSIENHNCDDHLKPLGYLSNGMQLVINQTVAEADLLVTTGVVGLHYFAGYSGGRKSIVPGVASRALIEANHQMMDDERACLGNYTDNPVSDFMVEAARRVGVDFILNVVIGSHHQVAYCAAGDLYEAWLQAVKFCEQQNVVSIKEKADIVIAGCGGYPKDINMYQAQKALDAAVLAVKPGGTIILAAECREGLGEKTFEDWVRAASCPEDIMKRFSIKFELGGHKAFAICRTLQQAEIILVSDLPDGTVSDVFLKPAPTLDEALNMAFSRLGHEATVLVMPEAPKLAVKITD